MQVNADAMLHEHTGLVYSWADAFYFPGGDRDDVRQIALLALWEAIQTFDGRGHFTGWAHMVVRRDLMDALEASRRLRHRPLSESVRTAVADSGEVGEALDFIPGGKDPADLAVERETFRELVARIKSLSPLERDALIRVVFCGEQYVHNYRSDKRIDNALQRARRKLAA